MPQKIERTLAELHLSDPQRAEALISGRRGFLRGFLRGSGLAAMGAALPFAHNLPAGLLPVALAQGTKAPTPLNYPGKDPGLVVLSDKPLVAQTPEHLLDDDTTPTGRFFIRNNGQIPEAAADPDSWTLRIDGEVDTPLELKLGEIKTKFEAVTRRMVLECGGNGRAFFSPPTPGEQWTNGGAGCAEWTGVALKDLLAAAGPKASAKFTGHYGADKSLSSDPDQPPLSRGMPIAKAQDEHTMLVWQMNSQPLPTIHGGPLRLLVPGWPGSLSAKWLRRIVLRETPHDGPGMGGTSFRVPMTPIVPGSANDGRNFRDLESMPVRAIVTNPANGAVLPAGTRTVALRGAAWDGDVGVGRVDVSADFGQTWQATTLAAQKNRYDWARWTHSLALPSDGYFEIWARATDRKGLAQPFAAANWNPRGYGANPINRIAVLVGGQW